MSPILHLDLNKDSTSCFIRCGLLIPRWYRPVLLLGPARAAPRAATQPSGPEYRAADAVHTPAVPTVAIPALPALPNAAPAEFLMAPCPTQGAQELNWTPGVAAVESGPSERIGMMALPLPYLPAPFTGSVILTPALFQSRPESAERNRTDSGPVKNGPEIGAQSASIVAEEASRREPRFSAAAPSASRPERSGIQTPSGGAVNMMVVKRNVEDSRRFPESCGKETEDAPRLPTSSSRPAQTKAVVSFDMSRCIVFIDRSADVSLGSARVLRPEVVHQPWSEHDGRITGVAHQGNAVLDLAVSEVRLAPVRALTPFVVALGVGADATLGVVFLYEHGISVNLAHHYLVFEAQEGMIVPLVGHYPRLKHACVLTHDVALYPGGSALVRFDCDRPGRQIGSSSTPEMYLIAAQNNRELGLAVPEQLFTELSEMRCTADHPLYLPVGWRVAKVQDCGFISRGPPSLRTRRSQPAFNMVSDPGLGEPPLRSRAPGLT